MVAGTMLNADRPIRSRTEDLLARGPLVEQLASWIAEAPTRDGFVIGVTGPWGSGKTSVLALLAEQLTDNIVVLRFDPWLFAGADQLVLRFFEELSGLAKSKGRRAKKLGQHLADYGAALSPAAGVILGPAGQLLAAPRQFSAAREKSVGEQREQLISTLLGNGQRIVVLIDDIDRLEPREVAEVMRLVKLVADLPGVVHVLSYDNSTVRTALEQAGHEDGRAYLEKIVQVSIAVPPVAHDRLRQMTLSWLEDAVGDRPLVAWDPSRWSALVDGGIDGYLKTLRDGRRLCNGVGAALDLCRDEVASSDVLALEAIRVFDPDVHERLLDAADALTGTGGSPFDFRSRDDRMAEQREAAEALLAASNMHHAARVVLRSLFPAAGAAFGGSNQSDRGDWRAAKRVAARPVLLRYLHLALATSEVPSAVVDAAVTALASGDDFAALVGGVDDAALDDLLARVRPRVGEQPLPDVVGCSLVALSLVPRMSAQRHFFDVDAERRCMWFVEDLLESIGSKEARAEAAKTLVERSSNLSLCVQLLFRFRRPPQPSGSPELDLLDGGTFDELRNALSQVVISADSEELAAEPRALWLVELVGEAAGQRAALERLQDRVVLRAVLTQPGTRVHPISDGRTSLHLEPLIDAAGDGIIPLLQEAAHHDDHLDDELRVALTEALARRTARTETEPDVPRDSADG